MNRIDFEAGFFVVIVYEGGYGVEESCCRRCHNFSSYQVNWAEREGGYCCREGISLYFLLTTIYHSIKDIHLLLYLLYLKHLNNHHTHTHCVKYKSESRHKNWTCITTWTDAMLYNMSGLCLHISGTEARHITLHLLQQLPAQFLGEESCYFWGQCRGLWMCCRFSCYLSLLYLS